MHETNVQYDSLEDVAIILMICR